MSLNYPTRYEFEKNESLFNLDMKGKQSPFDRLIPTVAKNINVFAYETTDDYGGLQQARGNEGVFRPIPKRGKKQVTYMPAVYGEYDAMLESELKYNTGDNYAGSSVTIRDMMFDAQERLIIRENNLLTVNKANFAFSGKIEAAKTEDPLTKLALYDFGFTSFPVPTLWSNHATSTPIYDLMNNIKSRTKHVDWRNGTIVMNSNQWWHFIQNTNTADLMGGVKAMMGTSKPNEVLDNLSSFLTKLGLPQIEVSDFAYINASGTETMVVPDDKIAVIGAMPSLGRMSPAAYVQTISLHSASERRAGSFTTVIESPEPPFVAKVYRGHDGAIECRYPEVFAPMTGVL
jgi:hypothetical protein